MDLLKKKVSFSQVGHLREEIGNYQQQLDEQITLIKSLEKLQDETQHVLSQQELTHQQETTALQNSLYELKTGTGQLNKELAVLMAEHKAAKKKNTKLEQVPFGIKIVIVLFFCDSSMEIVAPTIRMNNITCPTLKSILACIALNIQL